MICPECKQNIESGERICSNCMYPIHEHNLKITKKILNSMKKTLLVICIITLCVGIWSIFTGFDKKDNYYNSEYSSSLNENAYVGGDAYNYIINGTYFSGYLTLGAAMFVVSAITGVSTIGLKLYEIELNRREG